MNAVFRFLIFCLVASLAQGASAARWQNISAEDFWKLPDTNVRIDPANFDRALMAAAIFHETNRGYGGALRTGLSQASKDLVFYTDGDGQYDVFELRKLLPVIRCPPPQLPSQWFR